MTTYTTLTNIHSATNSNYFSPVFWLIRKWLTFSAPDERDSPKKALRLQEFYTDTQNSREEELLGIGSMRLWERERERGVIQKHQINTPYTPTLSHGVRPITTWAPPHVRGWVCKGVYWVFFLSFPEGREKRAKREIEYYACFVAIRARVLVSKEKLAS